METIRVCGNELEVIEVFDLCLLVQDPETLAIFVIEYHQIDPSLDVKYTGSDSNVISLKGYLQWPTRRKRKKTKPLPPTNRAKLLPMAK
jgi:hypothetical protein